MGTSLHGPQTFEEDGEPKAKRWGIEPKTTMTTSVRLPLHQLRCFTSAETTRLIRDGKLRTATSTFTLQCCCTSTEAILRSLGGWGPQCPPRLPHSSGLLTVLLSFCFCPQYPSALLYVHRNHFRFIRGEDRPLTRVFPSRMSTSTSTQLPSSGLLTVLLSFCFYPYYPSVLLYVHIVRELCESRGGRPGLSVLPSLLASVDVKID